MVRMNGGDDSIPGIKLPSVRGMNATRAAALGRYTGNVYFREHGAAVILDARDQ
jgi:hypothetical protein